MPRKRHPKGSPGGKGGQFAKFPSPAEIHKSGMAIQSRPWTDREESLWAQDPFDVCSKQSENLGKLRSMSRHPAYVENEEHASTVVSEARFLDEMAAHLYLSQKGDGDEWELDVESLGHELIDIYSKDNSALTEALEHIGTIQKDLNMHKEFLSSSTDASVDKLDDELNRVRMDLLGVYMDVLGVFETDPKNSIGTNKLTVEEEVSTIGNLIKSITTESAESSDPVVSEIATKLQSMSAKLENCVTEISDSVRHLLTCLYSLKQT